MNCEGIVMDLQVGVSVEYKRNGQTGACRGTVVALYERDGKPWVAIRPADGGGRVRRMRRRQVLRVLLDPPEQGASAVIDGVLAVHRSGLDPAEEPPAGRAFVKRHQTGWAVVRRNPHNPANGWQFYDGVFWQDAPRPGYTYGDSGFTHQVQTAKSLNDSPVTTYADKFKSYFNHDLRRFMHIVLGFDSIAFSERVVRPADDESAYEKIEREHGRGAVELVERLIAMRGDMLNAWRDCRDW